MTSDRQTKIRDAFLSILDMDPDEWSTALDVVCPEHEGIREDVKALLVSHQEARGFMARPTALDAAIPAAQSADEVVVSEDAGDIIGSYKLLQKIGEGGFGAVWMAEQREPVKRRVALKVIKLGMNSKQVIARFEAERQALAMMDHPNIAKVFDAGTTAEGRPYFVMEYIRGIPLMEYCDSEKLDTRSRLKLLIEICRAISHAHQKGIIHRDIKPANLLVTLHDGVPVPKVIDFGIAKATASELTQRTLFTEHHQLIGTPAYMSPEQAEMSGLDIDTRADIYALGVLLYELLTGTTPFASRELVKKGFAEMIRIIREEDPPKPSTRLSTLGENSDLAASHRGTTAPQLASTVKGDLDWIVMRCLEKDRSRRYESANSLAEDILRHLDDEPVLAGPPHAAYRIRKFAKRNRVAVLAGGAVVAVALLGFAGTGAGLLWALDQRDRADAEAVLAREAEAEAKSRAEELELVAKFQEDQLGLIDVSATGEWLVGYIAESVPEEDRPQILEVMNDVNPTSVALQLFNANVFDRSIAAIDEQFADRPLIQARLLAAIGIAIDKLGLSSAAIDPLQRSNAIYQQELGDEHYSSLHTLNSLSVVYAKLGRMADAEPLFLQVLETRRRVYGNDHSETLIAINNMGTLLGIQGRFEDALLYHTEALDVRRRTFGKHHPDTIVSLNNLASLVTMLGDAESGRAYLLESLEASRTTLGDDHPDYLTALHSLSAVSKALGDLPEAERYARQALQGQREHLGNDHPDTLRSLHTVGTSLLDQQRFDEALPILDEALVSRRRVLGPDHPDVYTTLSALGLLMVDSGSLEEAEALLVPAIDRIASLPPNHGATREFRSAMARLYKAKHIADPAAGHDDAAASWRTSGAPD